MSASFLTVICPSCFQAFEIAAPESDALPAEFDYDCEICCRPMVISCSVEGDEIRAEARGINE